MIGFVVFGLPDSASGLEIASHGAIALLLLLSSWRALVARVLTRRPSTIQLAAGAALFLMPVLWRYPVRSLVGLNDLALGAAAVLDALIEMWTGSQSAPAKSEPAD